MVQDTKEYKAAKAVADKLKAEQAAKAGEEEKAKAEVMSQLAVAGLKDMELPQSTLDFFKKTAGVGMESMDEKPKLPFLLKVTEALSDNQLTSGVRCAPGHFYYSSTLEDMGNDIAVSIAYISDKFYTKVEPKDNERAKGKEASAKFTQMVCGYFLSNGKPFIMFATGKRLTKMWEFAEEVRPFTKHKETPVPMYAFKVNMRTREESNDYGRSNIVLYDIMRDGAGNLQINVDPKTLGAFHGGIAKFKEIVGGFIAHNAVDKTTLELLSDRPQAIKTVEDVTVVDSAAIEAGSTPVAPWEGEEATVSVDELGF